MLSFTPAQKNLLRGPLSAHAVLWTITRTDGVVYRFTSHPDPIEYLGATYKPAAGYAASARSKRWKLGLDDAELSGAIDPEAAISSADITHEELIAGEFRNAAVTERIIDPRYPWMDPFIVAAYFVGDVKADHEFFGVALHARPRALEMQRGRQAIRGCHYKFGDSRCTVDVNGFTFGPVSVVQVVDQHLVFSLSSSFPDHHFQDGIARFVTGANAGKDLEVAASIRDPSRIALHEHSPYPIAPGDTLLLVRGCARTAAACQGYGNFPRFPGFVFLPTTDTALESPQSR